MSARRLARRPSATLVIAVLALFVALGGPAQARHLLTGGDIKDHSLQTRDLAKKAVRRLQATPRNSVGTRALRAGAVTSVKLADSSITAGKVAAAAIGPDQLMPATVGPRELRGGAVGGAQLQDGAVSGAKIADGTLDARDLARFWGRFRVSVPAVPARTCWSGEPVGLAPELADADISGDLVLATPDAGWPERQLAFTVRNSANRSRFVLAGCNATTTDTAPADVGFRYAVIDIP